MRLITMLLAAVLAFSLNAAPLDLEVNHQPYTAERLALDSDDLPTYAMRAASIGLEFDRTYTYREFAEAKRANGIGSAGDYEWLLLSTGGSGADAASATRAAKSPLRWEMMYLRNHNMTVIFGTKTEGERSYVRLLKLDHGRVPDLHLR